VAIDSRVVDNFLSKFGMFEWCCDAIASHLQLLLRQPLNAIFKSNDKFTANGISEFNPTQKKIRETGMMNETFNAHSGHRVATVRVQSSTEIWE
jgi:hypothetical protein